MPRRPKKNSNKPRPVNRGDSKINKWNKLSDIPLDEEEQFHANRDQILLNGEDLADDDEGDEDEVFALNGIPESSSSEEEEEEQQGQRQAKEPSVITNGKKKLKKKKKEAPVSSEDGHTDRSDEEETWGKTKSAYYSTNAAHFDSEDEEANELEEQEAKRLQTKARDILADDDFGLGDHVEMTIQPDVSDHIERSPLVLQPLPKDKQLLLRHLEKTTPETLALARDWNDIAWNVVKVGEKVKKMESESPDAMSLGMIHLHYQTLLTYATTLAFYLHLSSNPKYATQPSLLKKHPILQRLLTLKQSLATLEDLDFDLSSDIDELGTDDDDENEDLDLDLDGINGGLEDYLMNYDGPKRSGKRKKMLELDELELLLKDADSELGDLVLPDSPKRKTAKNVAEQAEPPKKKRKTSKNENGVKKPVFDLVEPEFTSYSNTMASADSDLMGELDVFGEQTALQSVDAADKKARKKSLQFHTAKIDSAVGRRDRGAKNALGGDDDIPYKERKKQKEMREVKELAKKTLGQGGEDLDVEETDLINGDSHGKRKRDGDNSEDGEEEDVEAYYSLVQKRSKEKKEQKKAEYEASRAAEKDELEAVDAIDGPRGLTSAILKNRGLTPHRSKAVRNPRVKKRMRFEKAKKKSSSQRAVYKGGLADSGTYEGEKTGISKTIKAVRL